MKLNIITYLTIVILIVIILLQNKACSVSPGKVDTITVVEYVHVIDTFYQKSPPEVVVQKDTIWLKTPENIPDTTYNGLLGQYTTLGNKFFEKKLYSVTYQIADYGDITVHDSISQNSLTRSYITTNLNIPITTTYIEKEAPLKTKFYYGISLTGNKSLPINGIYGDILMKTKREKIYSLGIGWTGEISYKGSIYWPLTFKK